MPQIFHQVTGHDLQWPMDDDGHFDTDDKELLASICKEYGVPFELVARMLEKEREANGMARRAGIQKALTTVLAREWRSEDELLQLFS